MEQKTRPSPLSVRFPENVRAWLTEQARLNNRSMNAEIINTFQELMREEQQQEEQQTHEV